MDPIEVATLDQWLQLAAELKKANQGRQIDCIQLSNAYAGNLWDLSGTPLVQDRGGRIMVSSNRQGSQRNKPLVVNYMKGIVDDYVALLGNLPDVKVPPPGSSEESQQFADTVEKYHYGIWHASNMALQMKQVAWWNSVMGNSVGIVWPDFKRKHPIFRFAAPYMLHSVPDVDEPFQLAKAIVIERFPRLAIQEMYPSLKITNPLIFTMSTTFGPDGISGPSMSAMSGSNPADGLIDVLKCFDKNEVVTIINNKVVARARHELGFCPVVSIPNILVPGQYQRGMSDIEQVIGLAQNASWLAQSYKEYVLQDIFSPVVVEGLMEGKVPEDLNFTDPNTVIPVNIGGKVYRLPAGNGSTVVGQQMMQMQNLIEYITGVPQVRMEGSMKSSITTGRGIDRAQGPYFSRTAYRTDIISTYLELMNAMAVKMQTRLWPNEDFQLMGVKGKSGSAFQLKMNTADLDDYTFNKVQYSMAMGMDPMQRMVFVKQGLQGPSPLFDRRFGIEFLGITDRPEEMLERADEDAEKTVQREMRLRAQASGQADPSANAANLEGGGTGAPRPLTVPIKNDSTRASGAPITATAPVGGPTALASAQPPASAFGLDPNAPPEAPTGQTASGLDLPLIEQVGRIVNTLTLKGSVWAVEKGEKVRLTVGSMADSRTIHKTVEPIYGPKVSVHVSKNVPAGAIDLTADEREMSLV